MKIKILKLIVFLILLMLIVKVIFISSFYKIQKSDDFLFFKLFSKADIINNSGIIKQNLNFLNNDNQSEIYKFDVKYKNMKLKPINLLETVDKKMGVYEKIAPGTKGKFSILLSSKQDLRYNIEFESLNEKPKNLKFSVAKNGENLVITDSLEELSNKLSGNIDKNTNINIEICWFWNYEENQDEKNIKQHDIDICDTEDAKNIKQYKFNVCVFGEEL